MVKHICFFFVLFFGRGWGASLSVSEREEGRGDAAGFRRSKDEIKRLTCTVDLENRFFLECNQLRRKKKKKRCYT